MINYKYKNHIKLITHQNLPIPCSIATKTLISAVGGINFAIITSEASTFSTRTRRNPSPTTSTATTPTHSTH